MKSIAWRRCSFRRFHHEHRRRQQHAELGDFLSKRKFLLESSSVLCRVRVPRDDSRYFNCERKESWQRATTLKARTKRRPKPRPPRRTQSRLRKRKKPRFSSYLPAATLGRKPFACGRIRFHLSYLPPFGAADLLRTIMLRIVAKRRRLCDRLDIFHIGALSMTTQCTNPTR